MCTISFTYRVPNRPLLYYQSIHPYSLSSLMLIPKTHKLISFHTPSQKKKGQMTYPSFFSTTTVCCCSSFLFFGTLASQYRNTAPNTLNRINANMIPKFRHR
jgi:hypothetical protein